MVKINLIEKVYNESFGFLSLLAGQLRVWSLADGRCVFTETVLHPKNNKNNNSKEDSNQQIVYATLCKTLGMIAVVTFDHNVILHELASLKRIKQVLIINNTVYSLIADHGAC